MLVILLPSYPLLAATNQITSLTSRVQSSWFKNALWDDGKAEVAIFDMTEIAEKHPRKHRAIQVIQSDVFIKNQLVRAKDRSGKGLTNALTYNLSRHVPLGMNALNQMASISFDRGSARPMKMTITSHNWADQVFKQWEWRGRTPAIKFFTTAKEQKDAEYKLSELKDAIPYEALPILLRAVDLSQGGGISFAMIEPQLHGRSTMPRAGSASVLVAPDATIDVIGKSYDVFPVIVKHFLGEDRLWIERKFPHHLVRWNRYNSADYLLRRTSRIDYWNKNNPTDYGLMN